MNREVKKRWVKALRSGEYQQGKYKLCTADEFTEGQERFCCLGVLVDIEYDGDWEFDYMDGVYAIDNYDTFLPNDFAFEVKINKKMQEHLAKKNDSGWSFEQIADYIEKNL